MPQSILAETDYGREQELELDSIKRGVERYNRLVKEAEKRGDGGALRSSTRLMLHWYTTLKKAISYEKAAISKGIAAKGRGVYGDYLLAMRSDKVAVITMHTVLGHLLAASGTVGPKTCEVALSIGRNIAAEHHLSGVRKNKTAWKELVHTSRTRLKPDKINLISNRHDPEAKWPLRVQAHLGACLMRLLFDIATTDTYGQNIKPAFEIYQRYVGVKSINHVRFTWDAQSLIAESHEYRKHLWPRYQPMIVKPLPWSSEQRGGYIKHPVGLIIKSSRQKKQIIPDAVYSAVNKLNSTPWRINKRILNVVEKIWDAGGGYCKLPQRWGQELPPKINSSDPEAIQKNKIERAKVYKKNSEISSLACTCEYVLQVARRFRDYDKFYFPHQLDFRGRSYPVPLFLQYQGDDTCRGLLEFANGKQPDRRWIELQMASQCGIDKVSFDTRLAWVRDSMEIFHGWIDAPLDNTGWMEHDKPLQALAAAYALFDEEAAAHLPVMIDGSNNGLQHYAAMLGCEQTGALVNLIPSARPADIYATICELVREIIDDDVSPCAEWWSDKLDRDMVKQPIMTTVYGVTRVGAREQLADKLKKMKHEWSKELYERTKYLALKTITQMGETCPGAKAAMDWLTDCACLISAKNRPVSWLTPLGFYVQQPYRNAKKVRVKTCLQEFSYRELDENCPVAKAKQIQGFAPNFIHSLDSTHMMQVANVCPDGVDYAAVHDAFWTHSADMERLSPIVRDQFVELHTIPRLHELADQFKTSHPDIDFPVLRARGGLDIQKIRESFYAFA